MIRSNHPKLILFRNYKGFSILYAEIIKVIFWKIFQGKMVNEKDKRNFNIKHRYNIFNIAEGGNFYQNVFLQNLPGKIKFSNI